MKVAIEWVTEVTEHHRIVLDEEQVPSELLDILADTGHGRWQGEEELADEWDGLIDREDDSTEQHADVTERTVTCIERVAPTPAEVGYHSHDGIRVAHETGAIVTNDPHHGRVVIAEVSHVDLT